MLGITTENKRNKTFLRSIVIPRSDSIEATFIGSMKDVDLDKAAKSINMLIAGSNLHVILNVKEFNAEPAEKSYLATELKKRLEEMEPRVNILLLVKANMINNVYIKNLQALHGIKVYNSQIQLKLDLQEKNLAAKKKK